MLWIDFDNGVRLTHDRFSAIGKGHSLPSTAPFRYVSMPSPWLDLSREDHALQLAQLIRSKGARFVVIDNLGLILGDVDENSAAMAGVMGRLRRIAEETGAAIIVIHHQRKSNNSRSGARKGDSLRGHSSIDASLNLALLVERSEDSGELVLRATKVRGPEIKPFSAQFTYEHKPGSKDLATARFYGLPGEIALDANNTPVQKARGALYEMVKELPGINKSKLQDAVRDALGGKVGVNKLGSLIDAMIAEDIFLTTAGPRNAILLSLNESYSSMQFHGRP